MKTFFALLATSALTLGVSFAQGTATEQAKPAEATGEMKASDPAMHHDHSKKTTTSKSTKKTTKPMETMPTTPASTTAPEATAPATK